MKATFHYIVKSKLICFKSPHEIEFVEHEEKFELENPLEAREKAFQVYQNYLNALLLNKGKQYSTDAQARIDLKNFCDPSSKSKFKFGGKEIDFNDSIGNGLGVFIVIDKPSNDYIVEDHIGDEYLIHGIGGFGWSDDPKSIMSGLTHEYWYYDHYRYSYAGYKRTISFYEYDIAQAENNHILETPFDWTGYNKPYNNNSSDVFKISIREQIAIEMLLKGGENNQVEFKPSLLYNHKTGKGGISIKGIIAKTICAFLNSNGGFLFIGVTNKGEIQGLQYDYSLANGKNFKDFFILEYEQMLEHFLSISIKSNVSGQFYEYEGKEMFLVTVLPSKHRPIFLNGQEGKEFFIRAEHSSKHMSDIEEIANYCIDTWTA